MSRIIVKQLPKNITEEKIRNTFGSKGTLTDVQLKYTPDGKFRQFCFIGYRSEEEAQEAIKFFNNSCIQTSRVKVELCSTLSDEDKPRSWSKYAKDNKPPANELKEYSEIKRNENKVSKFDEILGKHKDDPEFQEFMKVHDKNRQLWGNNAELDNKNMESKEVDFETVKLKSKKEDPGNEDASKIAEKPISDLEYMKSLISTTNAENESENTTNKRIDLFTIKMHNVPYKLKRQDIIKFFKPLKPYSVRLPTNVHGFCYVGFKTEKDMEKAMLKSKSFVKGKQVFFSDFTEKNKITKSKLDGKDIGIKEDSKNLKWARQEENVRSEENISESGKIFFRNLAYTVTEDDLQKVFEPFGPIAEINLPVDVVTRQIKGFGTVTFVLPEHAVLAFNKLDGSIFHGRLLHLIPGKNTDKNELDAEDGSLSFKQKKAIKLKQTAGNVATWNTLFMGSNAVASILAKQFGTSKEKILDTSDGGSSAAVRIALGETQIVIEMKKFLEDNGVCLDAFAVPTTTAKRSKTIILAKNLPADSTVEELTPLFAKFGPIGRIILPPSGVTALIEFCDPSEARQAFKKLAYSKFKNLPLYLEWAPENTFKTTLNGDTIIAKQEPEEDPMETKAVEIKKTKATAESETSKEPVYDDANEAPEPCTTIFLRNLNFKTVQDTIYKHFEHLGKIHTVEIAKRKDVVNPGHTSSMGYGFIQFKKQHTAEKALKQMQLTNIDGNQVELKRSDRILKSSNYGTERKSLNATKQTGTKILVRNIPFQAKTNEVRDLFKTFGELRSLRLPIKMTPGADTHRGFGFVDFFSKSDAKKAFEALSESTHLYGRRLVLEWASTTDEDVGELRKRTVQQFRSDEKSLKRSKKSVFDVDADLMTRGTAGDDSDE